MSRKWDKWWSSINALPYRRDRGRWSDWVMWRRLVNIQPRTRYLTEEQMDAMRRGIEEAKELTWGQIFPEPPEPPELKRWRLVRKLTNDGLSWTKAYERASKELAGTDAAGSRSAMKDSYVKVEKLHRDEQKRRQE